MNQLLERIEELKSSIIQISESESEFLEYISGEIQYLINRLQDSLELTELERSDLILRREMVKTFKIFYASLIVRHDPTRTSC
jgi:hypothetical protein